MGDELERINLALAAKDKEIEELEERIQKLEAESHNVSHPPEKKDESPFRFLDLPAELRKSIYELCLVKGTLYLTPRPKNDHRYPEGPFEKPDWALLRVNHQVRREAIYAMVTKNHFVLSYDVASQEKFWHWHIDELQRTKPHALPVQIYQRLKSVSITFDVRGFHEDILSISNQGCFEDDGEPEHERLSLAHSNVEELPFVWREMTDFFTHTEHLQVDITNAYCPLGCHRLNKLAAEAIQDLFLLKSMPRTLEVLGTKNTKERAQIKKRAEEGLKFTQSCRKSSFVLRFAASKCDPDVCLYIHRTKLDVELEDEEMGAEALLRWRDNDCWNS